MKSKIALGIGILLVALAPTALADDFMDEINSSLEAYKAGNYSQAIQNLNFCVNLLNEKLRDQISKNVFPAPLAGWTAGDTEGGSAAIMGGGVMASREYRKGDASVRIGLLVDSPIASGIAMVLNNPMFAASDPDTKVVKVKGERAMQKFSDGSGELNILLDNRILIQIEGSSLESTAPMTAYAEALDFAKVRTAVK